MLHLIDGTIIILMFIADTTKDFSSKVHHVRVFQHINVLISM